MQQTMKRMVYYIFFDINVFGVVNSLTTPERSKGIKLLSWQVKSGNRKENVLLDNNSF